MPRVGQSPDEIVDLPVTAGLTVFNGDRDQFRTELRLEIPQEGNRRIMLVLHGKDDLIVWIVLSAGTPKILFQVLFKSVHRFENRNGRPTAGRSFLREDRLCSCDKDTDQADETIERSHNDGNQPDPLKHSKTAHQLPR